MKNINSRRNTFTLIELFTVIAISGLFLSIVLSSIINMKMKARDVKRIADLGQIRTALELFYDSNGYYPQSGCGWDCNGYSYSYGASWNSLTSDLGPYIGSLPKDPINSSCAPWNNNCYSYAYGNVGRNTQRAQYDLTAQLENPAHPLRCGTKGWSFYFSNRYWCTAFGGSYSNQIYEASIN